jgi:hypothetical protein
MVDDETYIISPKDPASIVKLQDPVVIEQLLENPPAILAEILAGWFSTGNGFLAPAGCRIAQAAFKGGGVQTVRNGVQLSAAEGENPG